MKAQDLPYVDPLFIRKFTPLHDPYFHDDTLMCLHDFDVDDVGLAEARLDFDEAVVDCSHRVYSLTNALLFEPKFAELPGCVTAFPSRRWRSFRVGNAVTEVPSMEKPFLYIGNPVKISYGPNGITVHRTPEFLIRSGMDLERQYEEAARQS